MANPEHLAILKKGVKAWNAWRKANPEITPDLRHADMRHADMHEADLSWTELSAAKLNGADLSWAELSAAKLNGADLSEAGLVGADLIGSELVRAVLVRAVLFGAVLRASSLAGADLSDAALHSTSFDDVDLSRVEGLETVIHRGPSTIGVDTLYQSRGQIPDSFLRGAGVPEEVIQNWLPAIRVGHAIQFYSCFISYSHADKAFARRLHDALQDHGVRCWLDEHQLLPGDHIHRVVDEALRLWDKVLLCCSKASLTSWWVDKEVQKALMKEERLSKERHKETLAIIPLNLDGYLFDPAWQDWKRQHLTTRVAPDFKGWSRSHKKFETQLELVIKALRADPAAREKPPKSLL